MGSFDDAVQTIEVLLDSRIPTAVETVYTSMHIDQGCSIVDLFSDSRKSLGEKKLIFHTAYPPAPPELCPFDDTHFERLLDCHLEAVNWWFDSLLYGRTAPVDVYFKDLLLPLLLDGGAGFAGTGALLEVVILPSGRMGMCTPAIFFTKIHSSI